MLIDLATPVLRVAPGEQHLDQRVADAPVRIGRGREDQPAVGSLGQSAQGRAADQPRFIGAQQTAQGRGRRQVPRVQRLGGGHANGGVRRFQRLAQGVADNRPVGRGQGFDRQDRHAGRGWIAQ